MKPTRTCTQCKLHSEDLTLFVKDKGSKHGRRNLCHVCSIERNNKHPRMKTWKTDYQTKKLYNVNVEEYKKLMLTSDKCEVCSKTTDLCYDHDHVTMKFRGVLCRACNRALGQLGDNLESVLKVVSYLQK